MGDIIAEHRSCGAEILPNSKVISNVEMRSIIARIEELFQEKFEKSNDKGNLSFDFKLYYLIRQHKSLKSRTKN